MVKPKRLTVLALAATKGGVGKTTLASALAVRAAQESERVAVIDLDPQESLASWFDRRGKNNNPKLFEGLGPNQAAIELLISEGWEWVFIDTPPAIVDIIEPAIAVADVVLIPSRPTALDLVAMTLVEELCQIHKKRHAFILNQCMPNWKLNDSAATVLRSKGRTLLEPTIPMRNAYAAAMTVGKTGAEVERGADARKEVDALWEAVKRFAARKVRA
jgi:chromosome partitioning protein